MRVLPFVLALLLAGCSQPTPQAPGGDVAAEDPGQGGPGAAYQAMTQSGCVSFYSHHVADMAWARQRMPDGFEPYPRGDGAMFTTKTWSCAASEVDGNASEVGVVSLHYLAVQPPEALRRDDAVFYWLPLEIMTEPDGFAVFDAWGFPASRWQGRTFDHARAAPAERMYAAGSSDRGSEIAVDVAITGQSTGGAFVVRYFAARDGVVTGALDITVHPGQRGSGVAVLDLSGPDAPFSGPEPGDGAFQGWDEGALSYTWAYTPL